MKVPTALLLATAYCGTLAAGAALLPRDASAIVSAFQNINNDTEVLLADVNAFQGGSGGVNAAVKIQTDSNTLNGVIQDGSATAASSSPLNDADSGRVANAVAQIQPAVYGVLSALTGKKALFEASSLGFDAVPLVRNALVTQRESTTELGNNVTAKLSTTVQRVSPLLTANIDFHFVRAIQAFSEE